MIKICFVLSSMGGPKMLSSVFSSSLKSDVVYLVIQRMPSIEFLEALAEGLREEVKTPICIINKETRLKPGQIYFLSPRSNFEIVGDFIKDVSHSNSLNSLLSINVLMHSASASHHHCSIVVLSGALSDQDGINGILHLKKKGARVIASSQSQTPVFDMISELQQQNLIDELYPMQYLLEHLEFPAPMSPTPHRPKILVVDDEPDVRRAICCLLEVEDILTDEAEDGLDAIRKLQKEPYSAVFLDLQMPELDGLKALEAIKTIDPNLPILIVSGRGDQEIGKNIKNLCEGILTKPFTLEELRRFLPKLLKEKAPRSGAKIRKLAT